MIESEGWKEEIQKHVFIVNLENRRDMEEEEMEVQAQHQILYMLIFNNYSK